MTFQQDRLESRDDRYSIERLSDADWGKIREFLRQEPRAYVGRDEYSCRRFVEA